MIILETILFVLYVSYFELVSTISRAFSCDTAAVGNLDVSGLNIPTFVRSKPWISCDSSEYSTLFLLPILFTVIYVLGIPFFFASLLYFKVYKNPARDKVEWLSFYYSDYKSQYYSNELVWMLRRSLIVVSYAILPHETSLSIVSTIFVLFLAYSQFILPYKSKAENLFELLTRHSNHTHLSQKRCFRELVGCFK